MRIETLTIQGFRGFNEPRMLRFNQCLTLIYGPNSYGKTSVSEAIEWLLYGTTSRVEHGDFYKAEYKGSFRNKHFPDHLVPSVVATFILADGSEVTYLGELSADDALTRTFCGQPVELWPIHAELVAYPKPFILQHALKHLLLVSPDRRFQQFARLLGLEDLDGVHRNFVALATKPDACLPREARLLLQDVERLEARVSAATRLKRVATALKKSQNASLDDFYEVVKNESRGRVPKSTPDDQLLAQLLRVRDEAVGKHFRGTLALPDYSTAEREANGTDEASLAELCSEPFMERLAHVQALQVLEDLTNRAQFLGLGLALLESREEICPFCGQPIDESCRERVRWERERVAQEQTSCAEAARTRSAVLASIAAVQQAADRYHARNRSKTESLVAQEPHLAKLEELLDEKHAAHLDAVRTTLADLKELREAFEDAYKQARDGLAKFEAAALSAEVPLQDVRQAGQALLDLIACCQATGGIDPLATLKLTPSRRS